MINDTTDAMEKETVVTTPRLVFDSSAPVITQNVPEPVAAIKTPHNPGEIASLSDRLIDNSAEADYANDSPGESGGDEADPMPRKTDDLGGMSIEELKKHQEEIDRKIRAKEEAARKAIIDQIKKVMRDHKIGLEELVEAFGGIKIKRKGSKAKPKYQDPVSGAIWTGRGKEPAWIRGKDRTPFLIEAVDDTDTDNGDGEE